MHAQVAVGPVCVCVCDGGLVATQTSSKRGRWITFWFIKCPIAVWAIVTRWSRVAHNW